MSEDPIQSSSQSGQSASDVNRLRAVGATDAQAGQSSNAVRNILLGVLVLTVVGCGYGVFQFSRLYSSTQDHSAVADQELEQIVMHASRNPNLLSKLTAPTPASVKAQLLPNATAMQGSATADGNQSKSNLSAGTAGSGSFISSSAAKGLPATDEQLVSQLGTKADSKTEQTLVDVIAKHPQMMTARVHLIQIYASQKDYEKARDLCRQGLQTAAAPGDRETFRILMGELHAPARKF